MREAVVSLGEDDLEDLGLEELVSTTMAAGIRDFEAFACYRDGAVVQVEVETALPAEELRDLSYVDRLDRVETAGTTELYVVAFTVPELSGEVADHVDDLVGTCDPTLDEDGVTMSLVGPQAAIRGAVGEYQDAGLSPILHELRAYEGQDRPLDSLTDRQREVIETAHEMGYYEVPRDVSTADVAERLDLESSTVAEHLQRAERNLLTEHLAAGQAG